MNKKLTKEQIKRLKKLNTNKQKSIKDGKTILK